MTKQRKNITISKKNLKKLINKKIKKREKRKLKNDIEALMSEKLF